MGDTVGLDVGEELRMPCPKCGEEWSRTHMCHPPAPLKPIEMSPEAFKECTVKLEDISYIVPLYLFRAIERLIDTYNDGQLTEKQSHWNSKTVIKEDEKGFHIEDKIKYVENEPVDESWEATGQGSKWTKSEEDE